MSTLADVQHQLALAEKREIKAKRVSDETIAKVVHVGALTGGMTLGVGLTFALGFLEQRVRTKAGAPLSVGPVSLPAVGGMVFGTTTAILGLVGFRHAATVTGGIASSMAGMSAGTVGRGVGAARWMAKTQGGTKRKTTGELAGASDVDALSDAEIVSLLSQAAS